MPQINSHVHARQGEREKEREGEDELRNDSILIRYLGWSFNKSVFMY